MLTSFLRKSNPVNYLLSFLIISFFYGIFQFFVDSENLPGFKILEKSAILVLLCLSAFVLNHILLKEKSQTRNTFPIYLFSVFIITHWAITADYSIVIAGFFVILALRRMFAMTTGKFINKKIFDVFFFLSLASLFFPPALFFMTIGFLAIFYFSPEDYRNWLIPFSAIICVFVLKTSFDLLLKDQFFFPHKLYNFQIISELNFCGVYCYLPVAILLLFTIWAWINVILTDLHITQTQKKADLLLLMFFVVSLSVIAFSNNFTVNLEASLFFTYIASALIGGRYFEISTKKSKKTKEILLISLSVICVSSAVVSLWLSI